MKRLGITILLLAGGLAAVAAGFGAWSGGSHTHSEPPAAADDGAQPEPGHLVVVRKSESLRDGFPETLTVRDGAQESDVHYTGKFIRVRKVLLFPVHLYEIANYLEKPSEGKTEELLDGLLEEGQRKVFMLRFLKPLPGSQILSAINEEIDATFQDVDMDRLRPSIDEFVKQFEKGSSTGDAVYMAWMPGGRFYSGFNTPDHLALIASDVPFARAIWRIWAGPESGPERVGLVARYAHEATRK